MKNDKVITLGMFRINPLKNSREDNLVPNKQVKASVRTKPITISQPYVLTKKDVNSNSNGLSSTRVDCTAKTRRPQPRINTKNDRVPSAFKSRCIKNKEVEWKHNESSDSECESDTLVCDDASASTLRNLQANGFQILLLFLVGSFLFGNDRVVAILGYGDLQCGNILIACVYFVEGLGHNLFSVGQFCDSDLEVAFKRNTCFVKNLEGYDLLKGNRTTNLYTINLHEMTSISLLEDMDSKSAHMVVASKVPMLKPENGNTAPKTTVVEGVEKVIPPTTAEEKGQKRLKVKAKSTLMMGIPNEHQLKLNSIKDAKLLLEGIEKRFGGNAATKKTQINLLKQQYENFIAPSSKTLDQTFDRLQKLMSQLEILGETLLQEEKSKGHQAQIQAYKTWLLCPLTTLAALMKQLTLIMEFLLLALKRITVNGNESIGFDKSKVKCYNCHKRGHFARECRALRNQDNRNRESSRRSVSVETTTFNALVSCDGLGYDWSDQAEEGPTNSTCSKSCLETIEVLKSQYEQLLKRFKKSKLMVVTYKTGLQFVEERLEFYKKNESVYVEKINGLKWDIQVGEITIMELRKKLEIVQKEKDGIQFNKGLGYNVVPPPLIGNFMRPKPDLSFTGLEEFTNELVVVKPVVENIEAKASEEKSKAVRNNNGALIIEDWVSDSEEEDIP
ncbi:ribonuclease H-like domain-containing protein [Tanacetum coccineum]